MASTSAAATPPPPPAPIELDWQQANDTSFVPAGGGALEKSAADVDREYRYLTLANGLRAVLVSDQTTDKAAASMNVAVGQWNDPAELPGLAHFCEHMLFLGTEKYPDENEYSKPVNFVQEQHFFRSSGAALPHNSYGPDPHSCASACALQFP